MARNDITFNLEVTIMVLFMPVYSLVSKISPNSKDLNKIWEKMSALAKEQVNIFGADLGFLKKGFLKMISF